MMLLRMSMKMVGIVIVMGTVVLSFKISIPFLVSFQSNILLLFPFVVPISTFRMFEENEIMMNFVKFVKKKEDL